jgi:redox-sensitive bicupin YhaK (pirin superfamily)
LHCTIAPGGRVLQPVPRSYNAFVYVIDGEAEVGARGGRAKDAQMVALSNDGDDVAIANAGDAPLEALLIGGEPLREPVARYGPFVMSTQQEIVQAIDDFRSGRMGVIT